MQLTSFSRLGISLSLLLLGASSAAADVTVTVSATKDAMIFGTSTGSDTGNASGKGPALFAGADGQSHMKRSLITFDLAAAEIPSDATITGVTMTLFLAQVAGSGPSGDSTGGSYPSRTLRLFRLQGDWGEGPSGSPTSPSVGGTGQGYVRQDGDSSWDYAFYSPTPWQHPGGDVDADDVANVAFEAPYVQSQAFAWSSSGMLSDVRNWQNGQMTNYGWELRSDLEVMPTSFLGFWSKDGAEANGNPALAPQLTITFTGSGGGSNGGTGNDAGTGGSHELSGCGCRSTPTPGTIALFALVGLWIRRRRPALRDARRGS